MPAPAKSGYAPVNGIEIADIAKDHQVIVADSRGHGRSTRTSEPYGYDLMASDYLALLDFLKIDKASLVGWSDGGIIGLTLPCPIPRGLPSSLPRRLTSQSMGSSPTS
jgi:pimeloyl-ACP methyl ester carboxylesterase